MTESSRSGGDHWRILRFANLSFVRSGYRAEGDQSTSVTESTWCVPFCKPLGMSPGLRRLQDEPSTSHRPKCTTTTNRLPGIHTRFVPHRRRTNGCLHLQYEHCQGRGAQMMNSDSSRKAKSEPVYIEVGVIILMGRRGGSNASERSQ